MGSSHAQSPARKRGFFITFEGGEGVGKSTQIELLAASLRDAGCDVLVLREPGSSSLSEHLRDILLDPAHENLSARAELLLYEAARAQLTAEVILPALEEGKTVLCDRYYDSTTAYQGYARGISISDIEQLNLVATANLKPRRTFVLDLPPEVGLRRAASHSDPDRLEQEGLEFHKKVREGFLSVYCDEPERVRLIDADREIDAIAADIRGSLCDLFPELATGGA